MGTVDEIRIWFLDNRIYESAFVGGVHEKPDLASHVVPRVLPSNNELSGTKPLKESMQAVGAW
jgi:hypothetical protein